MPRRTRQNTRPSSCRCFPRRRGILFPNTAGPILVGRRTTLRAIDEATERDGMSPSSRSATRRSPISRPADIYPIATEGNINRALRLPDGTTQVWVQGQRRLRILGFTADEPVLPRARRADRRADDTTVPTEALRRAVLALFEKVAQLAPSIPDDAYVMAMNIEHARLARRLRRVVARPRRRRGARILLGTLDAARAAREAQHPSSRKSSTCWSCRRKIHSRVQEEVDKSQREYFLREQMKAIQRELGETDPQTRDVVDLRERDRRSRACRRTSRRRRKRSCAAWSRCRRPRRKSASSAATSTGW